MEGVSDSNTQHFLFEGLLGSSSGSVHPGERSCLSLLDSWLICDMRLLIALSWSTSVMIHPMSFDFDHNPIAMCSPCLVAEEARALTLLSVGIIFNGFLSP